MKFINADELIQFCTEKLIATEDDVIIQAHNNAFKCMRYHIKSLSSADVRENKHGEWRFVSPFIYRCSWCSALTSIQFNFCPNCGADMRGETNA